MVAPDGTSLITAGLDHWFEREEPTGDSRDLDTQEFHVEEWRLQRVLGVTHFRLPPDYRTTARHADPPPNVYLSVPCLRFPRWHFCPSCHRLTAVPLTRRGRVRCEGPDCRRFLAQVPFVAMCGSRTYTGLSLARMGPQIESACVPAPAVPVCDGRGDARRPEGQVRLRGRT